MRAARSGRREFGFPPLKRGPATHASTGSSRTTAIRTNRAPRTSMPSAFLSYRRGYHRRIAFHHHTPHHDCEDHKRHDADDEHGANAVAGDEPAQDRTERHAGERGARQEAERGRMNV